MNKKWLIVAAVVVLVAALGFAGYQRMSAQRAATAEAPAETAVVRGGTLLVTVSGTGSLVPQSEVTLAFKSAGRVVEVLVEEGEMVEAGEVLAKLETDELELQVKQVQANLAGAQANLAKLEAGATEEEIAAAEASVEAARADLTTAKAGLARAQANLDQILAGATEYEIKLAELKIEQAKNELWGTQARRDGIAGNPRNPSYEVDSAEASVGQAHVAVQIAQTQLEELKAGSTEEEIAMAQAEVDQAQGEVERAQAQVHKAQASLDELKAGATSEELAAAQADVDQAQASLEQAQLSLEQATLTAPMDGTVTALNIEPGEMASAGQPVVVLSDLAALEVDVDLDETDVAQVTIGQEARVSLDAFPDVELTGEVTTIASVATTQSGVVLYPVTIRLVPTDLPVRAGMTADVDIVTASQEDALIIPLRAVKTEGGRSYVDRLVRGRIERVKVKLGLMTATEVEITSGLAEGDVVVVVPGSIQGPAIQMPGPPRPLFH
ncbi:MAG: efflux RND transporter periplasmic adaptor subunit [Chloroflexota bacterium]|nr:efflux RND transporter periplasmic adaptor subunit [Chloroflexota bacterium]